MKRTNYLRGWHISEWAGTWYAVRYGVRMNTNSYAGIIRMILRRDE